jgi:hypothetical protein
MFQFPENVLQCVEMLRDFYCNRKSTIVVTYPILEIIRMLPDKEISIKLFFNQKSETFEIQAPTYKYYSKISHYDYNRTERRWLRNKRYLFDLIKRFKGCGLWELISNKDFIIVNSFNQNADHEKLLKILKEVEEL